MGAWIIGTVPISLSLLLGALSPAALQVPNKLRGTLYWLRITLVSKNRMMIDVSQVPLLVYAGRRTSE
jgi:hypothetical protein